VFLARLHCPMFPLFFMKYYISIGKLSFSSISQAEISFSMTRETLIVKARFERERNLAKTTF